AVGDDVEPRHLLLLHDAAHRVHVLLAEARVAKRFLEWPPPQHLSEPRRPRPGAGDGRGQGEIARGIEHVEAPPGDRLHQLLRRLPAEGETARPPGGAEGPEASCRECCPWPPAPPRALSSERRQRRGRS